MTDPAMPPGMAVLDRLHQEGVIADDQYQAVIVKKGATGKSGAMSRPVATSAAASLPCECAPKTDWS